MQRTAAQPATGYLSPIWRLLVMITLAVAMVAIAQPSFAQVSTGKGRLSGIVMDKDGNPIEGATVTLTYPATGDSWELKTDKRGRWLKGNMGRGQWNIDIQAPGYLPRGLSARVQEINRSKPVQTYLEPGEAGDGGDSGGATLFGGALGKRVNAGNDLYAASDFQGALAAFEAVLTEYGAEENPNPNLYLIHINAGNAAFELGDYDKAAEHYQATLAGDPANPDARMGMAKIYMMERKLDAALAELDQIDLATIQDPIVFYNIGNLLFDQGQSADAQRYYEMALERNPNDADSHMQVALCLIQQGKMDEAKPHLEKVIELAPDTQNAALAQDFLNTIG